MTDDDTIDGTQTETDETSLTVRRTFDAPRERVFRAFTDPEELSAWYAPGDMTARVDAWDAEVDGALAVSMQGDEENHDAEGTFVEVVENEKLVHTWRWTHLPDPVEGRVTVTFQDVGGGTEVTLTHEELPDGETVEEHVKGWTGILENLASVVGGP